MDTYIIKRNKNVLIKNNNNKGLTEKMKKTEKVHTQKRRTSVTTTSLKSLLILPLRYDF